MVTFRNQYPLSVYLVVLGMAIAFCVSGGIYWYVRQDYRLTLGAMETMADVIVNLSEKELLEEDYEGVEKGLVRLGKKIGLKKCSIFSINGEPLLSYPPGSPVIRTVPWQDWIEPRYEFFRKNGELYLMVSRPVFLKGQRVATLVMYSHHPEIAKEKYLSFIYGIGVILLLFCFFILTLRRLQKVLGQPWRDVEHSLTEIVDGGDFRRRLQDDFKGQVVTFAKSVDRVLAIVQERETKINNLEEHFEERLLERTLKLRALRDQAVAAVEARGEFLAHMSHEIRTPLNGMIGLLSLLKDVPLSEEHGQLLETATRSADSLLLIVNDILDLSKIEAGMIDFESITFDLREVVEETVSLFIDMANSKGLELLCDISHEIHPFVMGDPTRLRQIITNLVGNAVKFTTEGEVVFRMKLMEKRQEGQLIHFSVEDTGIGISKKAKETLFNKFTQAEGSTTRNYGGTGLGLNVCKKLVELQKGDIGVQSEEGQGSLFWFTLPWESVEKAPQVFPCKKLKKKNILIVDDNGTCRGIIEKYLSLCGARVFASDRADRVLVLLRDLGSRGVTVDILLIDYTLPKKDGLQLANEINIIFGEKAPEIHLLSSERGICDKPSEHGIRSVIYKPVRQLLLYESLTLTPEDQVSSKEESVQKGRDEATQVLAGKVLLVDDEPVNQKVGVMLLRKLGLEVDVAKGGREAVSMFTKEDYKLVLMDLSMPGMNGFEATDQIRKYEKEKKRVRKPIVALTANALQSIQERCLKEGMDDFISKPVRPNELADRLAIWLPMKVDLPTTMETKDSALLALLKDLEGGGKSVWNGEQALQFVSGDEELLCELMTIFLQRRKPLMKEIFQAMGKGDAEAVCESAHAFKGAVNHFSAIEIRNLAQALEDKGRRGDLIGGEAMVLELEEMVEELVESLEKVLSRVN